MNDPATVVQELGSVAAKWEAIAVELGMQSTDLDAIKDESPEDGDEDCLPRVANWWLGGKDTKPQWSVLVAALRSDAVGELELAKNLETKYCSEQSVEGELQQGVL